MKRIVNITAAFIIAATPAMAQTAVTVHDTIPEAPVISKELHGQFSEHLGSGIYGGIWVGEDSPIPNEDGYRLDVLEALRNLDIPVLRWPGGCFADDYHWMDGIGPREDRPVISNNNWGGTMEDNSFGTHEFLNLCEKLGCAPYVSGNVGSGTIEEMAKWVEYMTSDRPSSVVAMRKANGREKPWDVKYFGIGNEAWGCGGDMTPEYYSDLFRRYSTYLRNYGDNRLYKIASGASDYDRNWTDVLTRHIGARMQGIAMHYYTVRRWNGKGSATEFSDRDYALTLAKAVGIESAIKGHLEVMDRNDPAHRVDLIVDEWGTWYDVEPGTDPGHLHQQNTMRDAMVAALSLNIFHRHCDRIRMANIAQMVNVLQAMILTDTEGHMVLTPTYHVYEMYKVFQDAEFLPVDNDSPMKVVAGETYPGLDVTAARKDGKVFVAVTNTGLVSDLPVVISLDSKVTKSSARILTCTDIRDHNTFSAPHKVEPTGFYSYKNRNGRLEFTMPSKSIAVFELSAE